MLLGVTPDPPAKARTKVIISLIAISLVTANLIAQEMHLIRDGSKVTTAKLKRVRPRRPAPSTLKLRLPCSY